MYCIDIYSEKEFSWLKKYSPREKENAKHEVYLQIEVDNNRRKNRVVRKLNRMKIHHRCYEKRWERSNDYRKNFMEFYKSPYRCRYCNRKLDGKHMVVDHIVPIAKVKKSTNARMLLYIQNISEVNDIRNLAPSCRKCNGKKSDKIGLWWLKGILGKYKWYWVTKRLVQITVILLMLLCAIKYFNIF